MKKRIALMMILAVLAVAVAIPLQAAFADSSNLQSVIGFTTTFGAPPPAGAPANCPTPPAGAKLVQLKTEAGAVHVNGAKAGKPDSIAIRIIGKAPATETKGAVVVGKASTTAAKTFSVSGKAPALAALAVSCGPWQNVDGSNVTTSVQALPDGSFKTVPCSDETQTNVQITDAEGKPLDAPIEVQCFEFVPNK